jgi:hypothetical protein
VTILPRGRVLRPLTAAKSDVLADVREGWERQDFTPEALCLNRHRSLVSGKDEVNVVETVQWHRG